MGNEEVIDFFIDDTLKCAAGILMLVISYKIYRLRCDAESDCGWFKFEGHNSGGQGDVSEPKPEAV